MILIQVPTPFYRLPPFHYFFTFFIDCGVDLDLISNKEIRRLREGKIYDNECTTLSMKMALGMINFCTHMINVRGDATDAALKHLMTHIEKRKFNTSFHHKTTFECYQTDEPNEKGVMLNTNVCNPTATAAENEIVSEICVDDNFKLDEFTITDDDVQAFNTKSVDLFMLKDDESDDFNFF